jgi:hypothetical protein
LLGNVVFVLIVEVRSLRSLSALELSPCGFFQCTSRSVRFQRVFWNRCANV